MKFLYILKIFIFHCEKTLLADNILVYIIIRVQILSNYLAATLLCKKGFFELFRFT